MNMYRSLTEYLDNVHALIPLINKVLNKTFCSKQAVLVLFFIDMKKTIITMKNPVGVVQQDKHMKGANLIHFTILAPFMLKLPHQKTWDSGPVIKFF